MIGISEYTQNQGFRVVCIHYSTDPIKRTEAWKENASKGMTIEEWEQEYEMNPYSMAGSLVYPTADPEKLVIRKLTKELIPKDWTVWMALDPGIGAPCAALWIACSPDGYLVIFDEYYEKNKNPEEIATDIKLKEAGHTSKPWIRIIDPSAFNRTLTGDIVALAFARAGMSIGVELNFVPANNDIELGVLAVRQALTPVADFSSRIVSVPGLKNLFSEFKKYRVEGDKPRKQHNHLMDCLRYIVAHNPHWVDRTRKDSFRELVDNYTGYVSYSESMEEYDDRDD